MFYAELSSHSIEHRNNEWTKQCRNTHGCNVNNSGDLHLMLIMLKKNTGKIITQAMRASYPFRNDEWAANAAADEARKS